MNQGWLDSCLGSTFSVVPMNGASGARGECYLYDGCPPDGQVELCSFIGMDHCWAGGDATGDTAGNACPTYASATELQWSFFKRYAW
jgi:poly(3-hydroxybutyrate) depolymerase